MAHLTTEYTDIRDVKHIVEHFTVSVDDKSDREQVIDELLYVLTKPGKRVPT